MAFSIMLVVSFYIELFDEVGDYDKRRRHYVRGSHLTEHNTVTPDIRATSPVILSDDDNEERKAMSNKKIGHHLIELNGAHKGRLRFN
eukprot:scaffold1945_cov181-Ochromonas_danica.AAC.8